jgi:formylmethanofuran dehydrogenase subunit B
MPAAPAAREKRAFIKIGENNKPRHGGWEERLGGSMSEAWINGKPASLAAAAERAAEILSSARMPVIAGLGTDVAGARASILLAERLRGAYDHMYSARIFADLDVMRQAGLMFTTPNEARLRADVFLFIGKDLTLVWPAMMERLSPAGIPPFDLVREQRKLLWIAPARGAKADGLTIETLDSSNLHTTLAALRARVAGRPVGCAKSARRKLDEFAEILKNARFGVAVWGGDSLDSLSIEMLQGLIRDLNKTTRFSGLPLGNDSNASGVVQTSGWMTGFPVRTSFGRGFPEHDTWRFDATRMIECGEADAALWISAYEVEEPPWKKNIPLVALVPPQMAFPQEPQVCIEIGCPGIDHDSAEFSRETGSIVSRKASRPSHRPSVEAVIGEIAKHLGGDA